MSGDFNGKDYDAYFAALERRLDNSSYSRPVPSSESVVQTAVRNKTSKKPRRLRKSVIAVFLAVSLLVVGVAFKAAVSKPDAVPEKNLQDNPLKVDEKEEKITKTSFSFSEDTLDIPSENDAQCGIVINKTDGSVIAQRQAHKKAYPASTVKIMTLLVAAENIVDMDAPFTMTTDITDPLYLADASVAGFLNGETVPLRDMLYGMILPSGADAAMALAITAAGSEEAFVELMNKKAEELGLENTHFTNVSGLHDENNYSTVYDMAIMLDAAMENELCRMVLSTYQYTTTVTPQHPEGILLSGTLFSYMYGTEPETATILGGKTGFVNESGYCVASFGKANESEDEYIVVTFGNSSKWPAFYGQIDLYKEFAK